MMTYKVPIPNAFTINRMWASKVLFPLSIQFQKINNVYQLLISPQRVIDLCDIFKEVGVTTFTVFDVDHNNLLSLLEVTKEEAVVCQSIDTESIVIKIDEFSKLLSTLNHYNLNAFDVPSNWQEGKVIEAVLAVKEHNRASHELILTKINEASLFIFSHDDCYVLLETCNQSILYRTISRIVQIYTGTILAQEYNIFNVFDDIPQTIIDSLFSEIPFLTIFQEATILSENELRIGISKKKLYPLEKAYPIDVFLSFNLSTGNWRFLGSS
jgi:hypothetical protein